MLSHRSTWKNIVVEGKLAYDWGICRSLVKIGKLLRLNVMKPDPTE